MKKYFLFGFLGLVVIACSFALGLLVAKVSESAKNLASSQTVVSTVAPSNESGALRATPGIRGIQGLAELTNMGGFSSHFDRTVAIHKLVENADTDDLLTFWDQSNRLLDELLRREAQVAIIQRLVALDPMVALEIFNKLPSDHGDHVLKAIFREWSLKDLNQAVEQARNLDLESRNAVVEIMLQTREDLPAQQRRKFARQLNSEGLAIEVMERDSGTLPIQDPQREWTAFVRENAEGVVFPDDNQLRTMAQIARAWVLNDGVGAFDKLMESLPNQSTLREIAESVVQEFANRDPRQAFDLAVHVRSLGVVGTTRLAIATWSGKDPLAALEAVSTLESKYLREKLQDELLQSWARNDARDLLNHASGLPEQMRPLARKSALVSLAYGSPQEAAQMIGQIEDRETLDEVANVIAMSWSRSDISSAFNWLENEARVAHNKEALKVTALNGLASIDPQQALRVALDQPLNKRGIGPEAKIIFAIAFRDLDTAVSLLPQVREGNTRISAYNSVIETLRSPMNNDKDRAVDLFIQLTKEEDIGRNNSITTSMVFGFPRELCDALDRIESMDLRRQLASQLLTYHGEDGTFSNEQVAVLQETRQYGQESRRARRQEAFDRVREIILESQSTDDESD